MPRETPAAKKSYHHGDLRRALIEAGVQLLREKGVAGLSLREAARLAGVSHTAPYRHFKDKAALLIAIAELGFIRLAESQEEAAAAYPDDPRQQLITSGIAYVRLAVENPEITQLMFGGGLCKDDFSPGLQEAGQRAFGGLMHIIENGQKAGIYKPMETRSLALVAWTSVHGLSMLITAGHLQDESGSAEQIDSLAKTITSTVLTGMLA